MKRDAKYAGTVVAAVFLILPEHKSITSVAMAIV